MALLREWVDGEPHYTQLKLATSPGVLPSGRTGPIYEFDSDQSDSDEITLLPSAPPKLVKKNKNERRLKSQLASLADRKPVYLPPEIIHRILLYTQSPARVKEEKSLRILKNASLVCRAWIDPARRIIFDEVRIINAPTSIKRLRAIIDTSPELGRAVQTLDLSKPSKDRYAPTMSEIFRRIAGLLYSTPCISKISFLHVALSDTIRSRFFKALRCLRPKQATIISSSHTGRGRRPHHPAGGFERHADIVELGQLLDSWTSLEILSITGYCSAPRILDTIIFPAGPSYRLTELRLDTVNLSGLSLLYLVGDIYSHSLKTLELSEVTDLDAVVFERVLSSLGSTLERLVVTMHSDDGDVDDFYEPEIFAPLQELLSLTMNSDYFEDAVLDTVVSLPSIEIITLVLPSFSFDTASAAFDKASTTLERVSLSDEDTPESFWSLEQRWTLGKSLNAKGIDLSLNHADFEDIDDEWWGVDLSESWDQMERAASQKRNRFRGSRRVR